MEVTTGHPYMYGDQTILGFAQPAAPLLLNVGGLSPFLGSLVSSKMPMVCVP